MGKRGAYPPNLEYVEANEDGTFSAILRGRTITLSQSFTRPANTTAYASGDLVANSTTNTIVTPLSFTLPGPSYSGMIRRVRLRKSGTTLTNATFRVHLSTAAPTYTNGDNGALVMTGVAGALGYVNVDLAAGGTTNVYSDGGIGFGAPSVGSEANFSVSAGVIYATVEAQAAYGPASEEVFTLTLEVVPD